MANFQWCAHVKQRSPLAMPQFCMTWNAKTICVGTTMLQWVKLLSTIQEIGQLINLRNVSFAGNLMKTLPKEIGEWTKVPPFWERDECSPKWQVEEVYLSGNDYEALPNSIQEWKNLKELHLKGCDKLQVINPKDSARIIALLDRCGFGVDQHVSFSTGGIPKDTVANRFARDPSGNARWMARATQRSYRETNSTILYTGTC